MRMLLSALFLLAPWRLRRLLLVSLFGYKIHPTSRIGLSIIAPERLEMGPGTRIGSLTMCKGISLLRMEERASIGRLNWITGFPAEDTRFFSADVGRRPELIINRHAAITNRHIMDCTDSVQIGKFSIFAGFRSQLLTHSIDLNLSRQSAKPVSIGDYCFVGTGSIILAGSVLPDYSVLGAGSVLNKAYVDTHFLYAGNPAKPVKALPQDTAYFLRRTGFVH